MRPLLLCILAYLTSPLTAQFRMKLADSGFVKNNYFVVKAAFKDASGNIKLFGGVKGKISYKKVVWKTINCDPPKDNYFFFNRESVLSAGGSITVIGTYRKKYSDTLIITLPKPIRIVLPDTFTRIKVNEFESIKGTVEYSDGRIVRIEHDETLFSLFELKLPEDVIELFGKIKVPSDKYLRGLEIGVTLKSNPEIKGVYKIMPDYVYSLQFSASGSTGADGYKGSSGADGCADCSDRGEDGLPGEMGGTGGDGGNGPVLEVWLRKRNDSVTLVKVNGDVHHNVLNYVDLAHGGKLYFFVSGGTGGQGGKGGKGGAGLDEANGKGPGSGGQGGKGGNGGMGGEGGAVIVYTDSASAKFISQIQVFNSGGSGGAGGEAGKGGRGGRKENAGIAGTLITGRGGEDGEPGNTGPAGNAGIPMVVKVVVY